MSVEVLTVELEQRRQELQREQEENDLARRIRAEVLQPMPPPVRLIFPLKTGGRNEYDEAAAEIQRWWKSCQRHARTKTTNAQIAALCRRVRGLGRTRRK